MRTKGVIEQRYHALCHERASVLERGRRCSALTLPYLLPEDGHNHSQELPTPYQSIGAEGVTTMASKLGLAYFNPSTPFLRLEADENALAELAGLPPEEAQKMEQELNDSMRTIERSVVRDFDAQAHRPKMANALELLLVTGNILQLMPDDGTMRIFRLDEFAVNRDRNGNLLEVITEESMALSALEPDLALLLRENGAMPTTPGNLKDDKTVKLFSYAKLVEKGRWELSQELNGVIIPDSVREIPEDRMPYNFVPLFEVAGDIYGRSMVEKVIGDLQTLETLMMALEEGAVATSRLIIALRPGSVASPRELTETPNTGIVVMDPEDAKAVQFEKNIDLGIAYQLVQTLTDRLEKSFVMLRSVQRAGERVTATEINALVLEIESSNSGLNSALDTNLVRWTALRQIKTLQKRKLIPKFPTGDKSPIKPRVVTGFEGIGRAQDLQKQAQVAQLILSTVPPEIAETRVDWDAFLKGININAGLDFDIILSDEEIAANQQQKQEAAIAQQIAGPVAREGAAALREQAAPQPA